MALWEAAQVRPRASLWATEKHLLGDGIWHGAPSMRGPLVSDADPAELLGKASAAVAAAASVAFRRTFFVEAEEGVPSPLSGACGDVILCSTSAASVASMASHNPLFTRSTRRWRTHLIPLASY